MDTTNFNFNYLKDYVVFLSDNKIFNELSRANLRLSREANLPLLDLFSHLSEGELLQRVAQPLQEFFAQVLDDTALAHGIENIDTWKADKLEGVPRHKIQITDIVLLYSIRKKMFLEFLEEYTTNSKVCIQVMRELEDFYLQLERHAFQAYVEIQQEALFEKNEFLSSLIENSVDGISAFDREMRIMEWNPVLQKRNNLKKEDIIGKKIYDLFPGYAHSEEAKATAQALEGRSIYLEDRKYKLKEGWFDCYIVPLHGKKGIIRGALSIIRDITQRKEAEIKLQEHQEELMAVNEELEEHRLQLEAANEELQENLSQLEEIQQTLKDNESRLLEAQEVAHLGFWEHDVVHNTNYWSEEMKRIYGYNVGDIEPDENTYLNLLHPEDREKAVKVISRVYESFEPYSFEHRIIKADGSVRWLLAHGYTLVSNDNKLLKLKGTCLDITERKLVELENLETQHFIQKITDTTPDIITVFDLAEKKNIYGNKELYDVLGFNPQEVARIRGLGMAGLKEIIHPEDMSRVIAFIESYIIYTGNNAREIEYRAKSKAGEWIWIMVRYNIFKKSLQGLPIQIIGVSRDLTERKLAEERVKESERRLKESQAMAHLGHWELDFLNHNKVTWSDELYNIYGIERHEDLNLDAVKRYIMAEDVESLDEKIQRAIKVGEPYQKQYRIIRPNGEVRTVYTKGEPGINSAGEITCIRGITLDITDRLHIETELLESRHFSQAVVDAAPNIIFVYDIIQKKNVFTNKELATVLGYSPGNIQEMGSSLMPKIVHPDDFTEIAEREAYLATCTADDIYEMTIRIKSAMGEWRWIRSLSRIYKFNAAGKPEQILGITEDVTERKLAEIALHETNEELIRSEEALKDLNNELEERVNIRTRELGERNEELLKINADLDNFIYTASHDLKVPIANIEGLLNALSRMTLDKLQDNEKVLLNMMHESIGRFNSTIRDLTQIAKVQKDMEEEEIEKVSFQGVLDDVKQDLAALIKDNNATIITHFEVEKLHYARKNLRSIIHNLLSNALKYCSAERLPEVLIETSHTRDFTILRIQDNGEGIHERNKNKIFALFKRLHTHVEGSGMGLYIVKRIMENSGGSIEVTSELGKGTTFILNFRNDISL